MRCLLEDRLELRRADNGILYSWDEFKKHYMEIDPSTDPVERMKMTLGVPILRYSKATNTKLRRRQRQLRQAWDQAPYEPDLVSEFVDQKI